MGFAVENFSFLYLGTSLKHGLLPKNLNSIDIGVRIQRNFISTKSPLNTVGIEYFDHAGKLVGRDTYLDKQFAISLMLGIAL